MFQATIDAKDYERLDFFSKRFTKYLFWLSYFHVEWIMFGEADEIRRTELQQQQLVSVYFSLMRWHGHQRRGQRLGRIISFYIFFFSVSVIQGNMEAV